MTNPTIVLVAAPAWFETIATMLDSQFNVIQQIDTPGYMNTLIDQRVALIMVDAANDGWQRWVTPPKASPATRRIPIIVVCDSAEVRALALKSGADFSLARNDLETSLPSLLEKYARIPDPELLEQLECECQEALPTLARDGLHEFNNGEYYRQHDLFEEQWMKTSGPVRDLYRAVLQVGVAYYQIKRGNYRGALKMLQRSVQWLLPLPDWCQGINVRKLREDSFRVRAELEQLGENRLSEFNHDLLRDVEYRVSE